MYFRRLFLLVTEQCDSRCTLCDYWLIKRPKVIDPELVERRVAPFIRKNGLSVVCVSGGEPTLHPELPRIVRAVREAGASATLTTSTSQLEEHFDGLRSLVTHYLISLDGPDRDTYLQSRGVDLFDHVLAQVDRVRTETSAEVAISCVLQAGNIEKLRPLVALCLKIGVHRLFLRVPDLKPGAFGRAGDPRPRTRQQALVSPEQVEQLRADMAWLTQNADAQHLLGQSPRDLARKVKYFDCIAQGQPYEEEDQLCDVPLTSLVIQSDGAARPCFYLPQTQALNEDPAEGPAFREVYERLLNDTGFRRAWCNACQQFDGHKRSIGA
jgi:MoaA/NifB/PqqE/SkfB family radical SAM enzyme